MIRVFEAFSGYGSQSLSLRDCEIEHEVVGISEIDVDAIIAYAAIRFDLNSIKVDKTIDEMKQELISKNIGYDFKKDKSRITRMNKNKLELLYKADKLSKNFGDISLLNPQDLPDFDYLTYSFPCQSISISGKMEGIEKGQTRSGLLYECEKIIECKKPKYLLMENVKNLVGKKFIDKFNDWCEYLESLGYTNYHNNYTCLNAKDFGIPQNRERIFMVSILGEHKAFNFPKGCFELKIKLKDILEDSVSDKYYLSDELKSRFKEKKSEKNDNQTERLGGIFDTDKSKHQAGSVWNKEKLSPTLDTMQGGYRQPLIKEEGEKNGR